MKPLALAVDATVRSKAQDGAQQSLQSEGAEECRQSGVEFDDARADEVLELVKNQNEY
jgi:hypothetical protein